MMRLTFAAAALVAASAAGAREPAGLHDALDALARDHRFSGAVVVRGADGIRFARGYGWADPFAGRRFTPETPVDSASLAKPVTSAAVLMLAREGRIDLDALVGSYLPDYPHPRTTVRHLLAHSAGLTFDDDAKALAGKSNAALLAGARGRPPLFAPGSAFTYCNLCYVALALMIERVSGKPYLEVARRRVALPGSVTIRPARLADWRGRAIGHRRTAGGKLQRADSYEGEAFYGTANLSISASQLAQWGAEWWGPRIAPIRDAATRAARIDGKSSGLTSGNWYCAAGGTRCHYPGHHEGFHHMLYWSAGQRLSVAMVSNNTLAPALQQRLQRALVAFAEGRADEGASELSAPLPDTPPAPGEYRLSSGPIAVVATGDGISIIRGGIAYPAYRVSDGIRYVPGLDVYLSGASRGRLNWLSLYEDEVAEPR